MPSRPAVKVRKQVRVLGIWETGFYAFAFGDSVHGIRTQPERLRAEYDCIRVLRTLDQTLVEFVDGLVRRLVILRAQDAPTKMALRQMVRVFVACKQWLAIFQIDIRVHPCAVVACDRLWHECR